MLKPATAGAWLIGVLAGETASRESLCRKKGSIRARHREEGEKAALSLVHACASIHRITAGSDVVVVGSITVLRVDGLAVGVGPEVAVRLVRHVRIHPRVVAVLIVAVGPTVGAGRPAVFVIV